jgi:hypothetical protein
MMKQNLAGLLFRILLEMDDSRHHLNQFYFTRTRQFTSTFESVLIYAKSSIRLNIWISFNLRKIANSSQNVFNLR